MAKQGTLERTVSVSMRVNPEAKAGAEKVLSQLGLSMSTAFDMFLRQISREQRVPLNLDVEDVPPSLDIRRMTPKQLWDQIKQGVDDSDNDRGVYYDEWFSEWKKSRGL